MDDIYEYENSEYRLISMQLKAIAYDVVTGISKKKISLKKSGLNKSKSISDELTTISDRIIELADLLEEEFQKLDQIEEEREVIAAEEKTSTQKVESKPNNMEDAKENTQRNEEQTSNIEQEKLSDKIVIEEDKKTLPKEEQSEKVKIDLPDPRTIKIEEKKPEEPVKEESKENKTPIENNVENGHFVIPISAFKNATSEESKEPIANKNLEPTPIEKPIEKETNELSLPDLNIKTEEIKVPAETEEKVNHPTSSTPQQEPTITSIEQEVNRPVETKEEISTEKRFQKQTKNLSKAIMVRPNQLDNLRKSRKYQEQLLIKQGIFTEKEIIEEEKNPIEGPKELPDEVERQIEDLTVKANIYYNEGEVDKAQELYSKIRELNEQYK